MSTEDLRQCWCTPDDFFSVVNKECPFEIDVAADADNKKCLEFIDIEDDAFETDWFISHRGVLSAWCNPGFRKMMPWVKRAYEQTQTYTGSMAYVLGLAAVSTDWWHFAVTHAVEVRLLSPRVQYMPPPGIEGRSNPREGALFVFRRKPEGAGPAHIWTWRWKA